MKARIVKNTNTGEIVDHILILGDGTYPYTPEQDLERLKYGEGFSVEEITDENKQEVKEYFSKKKAPDRFSFDVVGFRKKLYAAFKNNIEDVGLAMPIIMFLESKNFADLKDYGDRLVAANKISQGKFNQFKALLKSESKGQIDLDNY